MDVYATYDQWIERCKRLGFRAVKLDEPQIINPTDGFGGHVRIELWWHIVDTNGDDYSGSPWQTEELAWEHIYLDEWEATLLEVRNQLLDMGPNYGDTKAGHMVADRLLLQAFRAMYRNQGDEDLLKLVEEIATAYEAINKQYSY